MEGVGWWSGGGGGAVWGGGGKVYRYEESKDIWGRMSGSIDCGATLGMCGGRLVAVGGWRGGGMYSKKVMVWRAGKWSQMSEMLVACGNSCVVSVDGGGLLVMGGIGDGEIFLDDVQVFDGEAQLWYMYDGLSLPEPCGNISSVVHGDVLFMMGGDGMDRSVWCANITDLVSH